jgi:hypothetical protein
MKTLAFAGVPFVRLEFETTIPSQYRFRMASAGQPANLVNVCKARRLNTYSGSMPRMHCTTGFQGANEDRYGSLASERHLARVCCCSKPADLKMT